MKRLFAVLATACVLAVSVYPAGAIAIADPATSQGGPNWLRRQIVSASDLPGYVSVASYDVSSSVIAPGSGPYYETIRVNSVVSAYTRSYISFDAKLKIRVVLVEALNSTIARGIEEIRGNPTPPDTVTRQITTPDGDHESIASFTRGRVGASIIATEDATQTDSPGYTLTDKVAVHAAGKQYGKLTNSPNLSEKTTISTARLQVFLYSLAIGTGITFLLISWFLVSFRDRGTREKMLRYLVRKPPTRANRPGVWTDDVSSLVRRRLWRYRAGILVRSIMLITLYTATFRLPTVQQIGVLLGVGLLFSLTQSTLARLRGKRQFATSQGFRSLILSVIGGTFSITLAGAGLFLFLLQLYSHLGVSADFSAEDIDRFTKATMGFGIFLLLVSDFPYRISRRLSSKNVKQMLRNDDREEILLLRAFLDDGITIRARRTGRQGLTERLTLRRRERFEELVAWKVWDIGPVVTLGEPGTKLPPLGAARQFAGDNWEQDVIDKIYSSKFIIFLVGRSPSLVREIALVRQAGALHRCLFVIPPVANAEIRTRLTVLTSALGLPESTVPRQDLTNLALLCLSFDLDGAPRLTVADSREDLAYQVALHETTRRLAGTRRSDRLNNPSVHETGRPRVVTSLLRISPTHRETRAARRRRRLATWPWLASLTLTAVSSLILVAPSATALPPLPGVAVTNVTMSSASVTGAERFLALDRPQHALVDVSGQRSKVVFKFERTPGLLLVAEETVYVTTLFPYHAIALRRSPDGYSLLWDKPLPAAVTTLATTGTEVAFAIPSLNQVLTLDTARGTTQSEIPIEGGPWSILAYKNQFLVGSVNSLQLSFVSTGEETSTIELGLSPTSMRLAGDRLFVGSVEDGSITEYSLPSGEPLRRVSINRFGGVFAIAENDILAATDEPTSRLVRVSRTTFQAFWSAEIPSQAYSIVSYDNGYYCSFLNGYDTVRMPPAEK